MNREPRNREAGVVLIAVLWGVIVLASIAFALTTSVRVASDGMLSRKQHLQAYYLARGGIFRTLSLLAKQAATPEAHPLKPGQGSVEWNEPLGRVTVEIAGENAKIDLNTAPKKVLERLGVALGLDLQSAHALAEAIADWRDPHSLRRPRAAGYPGPLSMGLAYRQEDFRFQSVAELFEIPGVTPELYSGRYEVREEGQLYHFPGLRDCVTVDSHVPQINLNSAPYPVLLAVPGLEPRVASYIVEARAKKPFTSVSELSRQFPVLVGGETLSFLTTESSGRYTLVARGSTPGGVSGRVRALVEVQGAKDAPFRILAWEDSYVR